MNTSNSFKFYFNTSTKMFLCVQQKQKVPASIPTPSTAKICGGVGKWYTKVQKFNTKYKTNNNNNNKHLNDSKRLHWFGRATVLPVVEDAGFPRIIIAYWASLQCNYRHIKSFFSAKCVLNFGLSQEFSVQCITTKSWIVNDQTCEWGNIMVLTLSHTQSLSYSWYGPLFEVILGKEDTLNSTPLNTNMFLHMAEETRQLNNTRHEMHHN